jgi:hypothetical protein
LKTAVLLGAFAASLVSVAASAQVSSAQVSSVQVSSAQASSTPVYGERPQRYGNTASFFFYDNRDDQRDFPTNGIFPGNFAADRFFAGIGAAGWLGSNPQHSAAPYPSQSYTVDVRGVVTCPHHRIERASDGQRYVRCLAP